MKRFLLALLFPLLAFGAEQTVNLGSSANDHTGEGARTAFGKLQANDDQLYLRTGHLLYAKDYGVVADGVTSDDVALGLAAAACSAAGAHLLLPAGTILLDGTGGNSAVLDGCWMSGSGGSAGYNGVPQGTTFHLTSTTVSPFKLEKNFTVSDMSFYWPNQTNGTTVYPPLFADGGTAVAVRMTHGIVQRVTVVNAYDGFTVTVGGGTGDVKILDSTMFAVHRMFTIRQTGDSWVFNNLRFTPGPWLNICNNSVPCMAAVNAGGLVNSIFYIGTGGTVTLTLSNTVTFDWRYGIYVESGALLGASNISWTMDGMGTIVDSSANSTAGKGYSVLSQMTGSMTVCGAVITYPGSVVSGHYPCFNLGVASGLRLENMKFGNAQGDFIDAAGTNNIRLVNLTVTGVGNDADGSDYYFLHATGTGQQLRMSGNYIIGVSGAADAHSAHGFLYPDNAFSNGSFILKDNVFAYMTDIATLKTANTIVLQGNQSFNTYASGATLNLTGAGSMVYDGNYWDITPTSLLTQLSSGTSTNSYTLAQGALPFILPSSATMGINGDLTLVAAVPATVPAAYVFAYPGTIGNATAASVTITGTAGQFACTCTGLAVGQYMTLSGTYGGTGSITSYSDPTTYKVSVTDGTSTFTLKTVGDNPIVTTAGTPTGITYAAGGGWFYATGSSTSHYTLFDNLYTTGTPAIPASPTSFSTTGAGAYTAPTSIAFPGPQSTLAGGALGINGGLNTSMLLRYDSSANAKTVQMLMGGMVLLSTAPTTTTQVGLNGQMTNVGSASVQNGWQTQVNSSAAAALVIQTAGSTNTAADQTLQVKMTLAAATDTIELAAYSIMVRPN